MIHDVTAFTERVEDWEYTDRGGHVWTWANAADLESVVDLEPTTELPGRTHGVCPQCGDTVTPKERPSTTPAYVRG